MQRVGPFRLEYVLGQGGMGKVYRAVHETLDHAVALKAVDLERVDLGNGRTVLGAEVRAMARLDHPGIARVFAHGLCGPDDALPRGTPWYATELLSSDLLRATRAMTWTDLAPVLDQLLDALGHAHARGVVHRDLKASNVLFGLPSDDRPGPKLVDFGIAASGPDSLQRAGSPSTMAPEQGRRDLSRIGPWTDVYAFGGLVWRLLTGRRPFGEAEGADLQIRKSKGRLDAFEPRLPVPDHVEGWLRTCLAPEPAERFPSAAVARAALRQQPEGLVPTWRDPAPEPLPRKLAALGESLLAVREPVLGSREAERSVLWRALADTVEQGRSHVVSITGPEGVGASALGRWWVERAHTHADALHAAVAGRVGPRPDAALHDLVDGLLQPFGPPRDTTARRQALATLAPGADDEALWVLDAPSPLPRAVDAVATLLQAVAARRPVALFLDDAGIDAGLGMLSARLQDLPVPLAVVVRETVATPGRPEVPVGPLRATEASEVLARLLPLTPAVHAAVLDRSFGSPPAMRQLLLQLRADLVPTARGFDHPLPLPEVDRETAFLDALPEADLLLLAQGAVLGRDVPLVLWSQASGQKVRALQSLLDRLEGWGWLPAGSHSLMLPAALAAALRSRARTLGQLEPMALRAARALHELHGDPLAEGRCWRDGGRPGEAVRAWLDHWRSMVFRHGPRVVLGVVVEARQLLATVPEIEALHGRRLQVELRLRFFLRDPDLARLTAEGEAWASALGWIDTATLCARALAYANDVNGSVATACHERLAATWLDRCSEPVAADVLISWYHHAERFALPQRDDLFARALALAEASADPHIRGQASALRRSRYLRDRDPRAIEVARDAVAFAQQHSPLQLCQNWSQLSLAYQQQGRIAEAEQACLEMASAAQWLGQPQAHTWALANHAGLAASDGRWDEAGRRAERALAGSDLDYLNAVMKLICAVPLARRGRWGEVRMLWPSIETYVPRVKPFDVEVVAALEALEATAAAEAHPMLDRILAVRDQGR